MSRTSKQQRQNRPRSNLKARAWQAREICGGFTRVRLGARILILMLAFPILAGCRQDMHDQPKLEPLEASDFFADGWASRPLVEGTIARGQLRLDDHLYAGKVNGDFVSTFPFPITEEILARGQQRYNIYCSPCHGYAGYGDGIIVRRGFRQPSSLHIDRLREERAGYFFDVITNGFGTMYSYASRVKPEDRWAIIAYIRALQLSQNASPDEVPEEVLDELRRSN